MPTLTPQERIIATIDPNNVLCPLCNSITPIEDTWGKLPHKSQKTDMLKSALLSRMGNTDHLLKNICVSCILEEQKEAWW